MKKNRKTKRGLASPSSIAARRKAPASLLTHVMVKDGNTVTRIPRSLQALQAYTQRSPRGTS